MRLGNLVQGVQYGLVVGLALAAVPVVGLLFGARQILQALNVSLLEVGVIYVAGAVSGGAIAGALWPQTLSLWRYVVLGYLSLLPFSAMLAVGIRGPDMSFGTTGFLFLAFSLMGPVVGIYTFFFVKDQKSKGLL